MSDAVNDGLDDILNRAFAHEYATLVDSEFVDRVCHSIRLQSRIRLLVLGIALAIGTIVCAGYVLPVIANIGTWLSPLTSLTNDTLMALSEGTLKALSEDTLKALPRETLQSALPIGLLILIAPCLFILVDEPI
jgi:hypothetical protein